jgi:hypothetical protein
MSKTVTTRGSGYTYQETREWTNLIAEPKAFSRAGTYSEGYSSQISYGDDYANWKDRIRRHEQCTTLISGFENTFEGRADGYAFLKYRNNIGLILSREMRGSFGNLSAITTPDPSAFTITSVLNSVMQETNSKIRAAQKSLQGLTSLGEMGETVRMINSLGRDMFGSTQKYLRDLSKVAKYLTPQNITRTLSERWLEYRFGIRPLVSDISGFVDACYQARYGREPVQLIRTRRSSEEKNPTTRTNGGIGTGFEWVTVVETTRGYSAKLYGAVGLTADNNVPTFRSNFGLTLDEFIPTVWELIPYSFLVDYFTNLGAVIDGYSLNRSGVKWLALGEERRSTCKLSAEVKIRSTITASSSNKILDSIIRPSSPCTRTRRYVSRGPFSYSSVIPELEFRIPGCSTQWLNIGALAHLHADASHRLRQRMRL